MLWCEQTVTDGRSVRIFKMKCVRMPHLARGQSCTVLAVLEDWLGEYFSRTCYTGCDTYQTAKTVLCGRERELMRS